MELPPHNEDVATDIFVKTERIVNQARRSGRGVCIFRLAIVYGKRFSMELMIDLARKGPVPFSGDSVLTFVHVRDVGRALAHAVEKSLDGIYNIDASPSSYRKIGKVLTNREFFGELSARENPPFEIEWVNLVKGWAEVSNDAIPEHWVPVRNHRPVLQGARPRRRGRGGKAPVSAYARRRNWTLHAHGILRRD